VIIIGGLLAMVIGYLLAKSDAPNWFLYLALYMQGFLFTAIETVLILK
jgi:hypothetical protein